jgi:hypothetical protein
MTGVVTPAVDDLGRGDYCLGFVDGMARRPFTDRPVLSMVAFTAIDLVTAFELGREIERRTGAEAAAIRAEVEESLQILEARLLGRDAAASPAPRRRRRHPHLRLVQ